VEVHSDFRDKQLQLGQPVNCLFRSGDYYQQQDNKERRGEGGVSLLPAFPLERSDVMKKLLLAIIIMFLLSTSAHAGNAGLWRDEFGTSLFIIYDTGQSFFRHGIRSDSNVTINGNLDVSGVMTLGSTATISGALVTDTIYPVTTGGTQTSVWVRATNLYVGTGTTRIGGDGTFDNINIIVFDSNTLHTWGAETVVGYKTFMGNVRFARTNGDSSFLIDVINDEIYAVSDMNVDNIDVDGQFTADAAASFDFGQNQLTEVGTPGADDFHAANKLYVDNQSDTTANEDRINSIDTRMNRILSDSIVGLSFSKVSGDTTTKTYSDSIADNRLKNSGSDTFLGSLHLSSGSGAGTIAIFNAVLSAKAIFLSDTYAGHITLVVENLDDGTTSCVQVSLINDAGEQFSLTHTSSNFQFGGFPFGNTSLLQTEASNGLGIFSDSPNSTIFFNVHDSDDDEFTIDDQSSTFSGSLFTDTMSISSFLRCDTIAKKTCGNTAIINILNCAPPDTARVSGISFNVHDGDGVTRTVGKIYAHATNIYPNNFAGIVHISAIETGEIEVKALSITPSARVGVGTGDDEPKGRLHIRSGLSGIAAAPSVADDVVIENNGAAGISIWSPNANSSNIYFGSPSDISGVIERWDPTAGLFSIGGAATNAEVAITSGAFVEAVRIDSGGQVGINNTNPNRALDVSGTTATTGLEVDSGISVGGTAAVGGLTVHGEPIHVGRIIYGEININNFPSTVTLTLPGSYMYRPINGLETGTVSPTVTADSNEIVLGAEDTGIYSVMISMSFSGSAGSYSGSLYDDGETIGSVGFDRTLTVNKIGVISASGTHKIDAGSSLKFKVGGTGTNFGVARFNLSIHRIKRIQ